MRILLAGLVLALAGVPVALSKVNQTCPDCRGADRGRSTFVRKGGYCRTPVAAIRCPRCSDQGTVTALNGLRGVTLNPDIAELIRTESDPYNRRVLDLIDRLVRHGGYDPRVVCGWETPPSLPQGWARFEKADGKDYVVAFFYPDQRPGPVRAGVILFDLRGKVLDFLSYESEGDQGHVFGKFIDGAVHLQVNSRPAARVVRRITVANDRFVVN